MNTILIKYFIIVIIIVGVIGSAYYQGRRDVYKEWKLHQLKIDKELSDLKARTSEITTKVITVYGERIKVVKEKNNEIVKQVDTITPKVDDKCIVTNNVVGMLNSAVQNTIPHPSTIADEGTSPFKISDITRNTIENYGTCYEYKEQIKALQNWINEQNAIK